MSRFVAASLASVLAAVLLEPAAKRLGLGAELARPAALPLERFGIFALRGEERRIAYRMRRVEVAHPPLTRRRPWRRALGDGAVAAPEHQARGESQHGAKQQAGQ